ICVDATSSMAGIQLDWLSADIWFASVQKCFGLPAGLAVLICSPRAIQKAQELQHLQHYNSLVFMARMAEVYQTTYTPNVLNIFLLKKLMQTREPIDKVAHKIKQRADILYQTLLRMGYTCLIADRRLRSDTVIALKDHPEKITFLKKTALQEGFLLGNGYGKWKENTFRIANFPAISDEAMEKLLAFLKKHK
ncbi:MAG: aminotransferase class V-fold PLP-dependent enzyme, partial [Flammeovirgaceae bacterium]|nr:aminotransferase class V-fold PLP-dependent enzyme [Flammeovirgaceae bacterium]